MSVDSTDKYRGPIPGNRLSMCLYYVSFVVLFSFLFLNIFVALIIVTFQEQGEKEITGCELDKNQVCAFVWIYIRLYSVSCEVENSILYGLAKNCIKR